MLGANTTGANSYIYSIKLVSGYSVITLPSNIIIPNLKKIFIRKFGYNFNQANQYVALLSIQGFDLHSYFDGQVQTNYTISLFNVSGVQNTVVNYINNTDMSDINLLYGSSQSQFTITINTDYGTASGNLGQISVGGSPFITPSNPVFLELQFE